MMGPISAVESVVFKSFNFTGRATRAEYWWWALAQTMLMFGCVFIDYAKLSNIGLAPLNPLEFATIIFALLTIVPNLSVSIRRLHDSGHSGFWYFILFVPVIGSLWFLVLMLMPSENNDNIYGPTLRRINSHKGVAKNKRDPMQGYAVLDRLHDEPTEEMRAARKQEVRNYYRERVMQT